MKLQIWIISYGKLLHRSVGEVQVFETTKVKNCEGLNGYNDSRVSMHTSGTQDAKIMMSSHLDLG